MVEILWGECAEGVDNRRRRVRTHLGALMRGSGSFHLKSGIQSDFVICLRGGNCPISYSKCGIGIVFKVNVSTLQSLGHVRPLLLLILVDQCNILYLERGPCWTFFIHCGICQLFFNQNWVVGGVIPHSFFGILDPVC